MTNKGVEFHEAAAEEYQAAYDWYLSAAKKPLRDSLLNLTALLRWFRAGKAEAKESALGGIRVPGEKDLRQTFQKQPRSSLSRSESKKVRCLRPQSQRSS